MSISYNTLRLNGAPLHAFPQSACFASIWYHQFGEWGVQYFPKTVGLNNLQAIEFLTGMKEAGFYIPDPVAIVMDKKYFIPTWESPLGSPVARAWVFGNLTLVRYLEEFSRVVYEYLELRKILPEANQYHLLQ